jgi:hypothetical protein
MDYQRIYNHLIDFRKQNKPSGYSEKHHIQMRSLGGSDSEDNLVRLTGREHYIAHLLLARFNRCSQTICAVWMMQCKASFQERPEIKSSRMYEWIRAEQAKYASIANTGKSPSAETREKLGRVWKGRKQTEEHKRRRAESHKGHKHSEESKEKMRLAKIGKTHSDETKLKMSESAKGKIISDEQKEMVSKVHKGKVVSEETKLKIKETKKLRKEQESCA